MSQSEDIKRNSEEAEVEDDVEHLSFDKERRRIDGVLEDQQIEPSTEGRLRYTDQAFDKLLEQVLAYCPEAEKIVAQAAIEQMRKVAEQMRHVSDIKNLQELKVFMNKQWQELEEIAGGNPELLDAIHQWGSNYIDEKKLYYDYINEVKDDVVDASEKIEDSWQEFGLNFAIVEGKMQRSPGFIDLWMATALNNDLPDDSIDNHFGDLGPITEFFEKLQDPETAFSEDLPFDDIHRSLKGLNMLLRTCARVAAGSDTDENLNQAIEAMGTNLKGMRDGIREIAKIYKVTKKLRDTHFLDLYNQGPSRKAA